MQNSSLTNISIIHSLQKVSEEIQQAFDVVDYSKNMITNLQNPFVKGGPWYQFPFGTAKVTEVNKALESLLESFQKCTKLITTCQNFQNENDRSICKLIGLLAMAEANSYAKIHDLSSEVYDLSTKGEEFAGQLEELEKSFFESIDDSKIDNSKKKQQMSLLIDYITRFSESKTKKVQKICLSINELEKKLSQLESNQSSWQANSKEELKNLKVEIQNNIIRSKANLESSLQGFCDQKILNINIEFNQFRNNLQTNLEKQKNIISEAIESQNNSIRLLQSSIEEENEKKKSILSNINIHLSNIEESVSVFDSRLKLIEQFKTDVEEKRTFLDSYLYKVMVGVCSISALVAAVLSYL